jgi:hypothetical protein
MTDQSLENLILRTVERWWAGRYSERHGMVTSYDPDKYLAKVKFQPEGQESGWIPIETGHIGNGYGIAVGLVPGNGGSSFGAQKQSGGGGGASGSGGQQSGQATGDQVIVRYQENDFESGKIVQRVHSDQDKPPRVESGEMVLWTQWGQQVRFNKDGSLTFKTGVPTGTDKGDNQGQGGQSSQDSQGNPTPGGQSSTKNAKKVTVTLDSKGNITTQTDNDMINKVGHDMTSTAGHNIDATAQNTNYQLANKDKVILGERNDATPVGTLAELSEKVYAT